MKDSLYPKLVTVPQSFSISEEIQITLASSSIIDLTPLKLYVMSVSLWKDKGLSGPTFTNSVILKVFIQAPYLSKLVIAKNHRPLVISIINFRIISTSNLNLWSVNTESKTQIVDCLKLYWYFLCPTILGFSFAGGSFHLYYIRGSTRIQHNVPKRQRALLLSKKNSINISIVLNFQYLQYILTVVNYSPIFLFDMRSLCIV